jgi:hypothetical protein
LDAANQVSESSGMLCPCGIPPALRKNAITLGIECVPIDY